MITGIAIENFKGIRDRVEIELRPITLLFGPNSAGKSTILHAIHYAREIFERRNLDPDHTLSGGKNTDLGGFQSFVHSKNLEQPIRLSFRVNMRERDEDYFEPLNAIHEFLEFDRWTPAIMDAFGAFSFAETTVSIAWSEQHNRPYISSCEIKGDNEPFATIISDPDARRVTLTLDTSHPSLSTLRGWAGDDADLEGNIEQVADVFENPDRSCLAECLPFFRQLCLTADDGAFFLHDLSDALPTSNQTIPFALRPHEDITLEDKFPNLSSARRFGMDMIEGLSRLVIMPIQEVSNFLTRFRYLGPLRETPPRNFQPPRFSDPLRWSSGLGAWDELQNGSDSFVEDVGNWLGDEDKLNSGYRIERRHYIEVDLADPLILQLLNGRAFDEADPEVRLHLDDFLSQTRLVITSQDSDLTFRPHDVGIGISQVVPVVATALHGEKRLLAIEQPELHLHPKLQAELTDMFIESALGERQHVIVLETHSELIPLRLMRRIRETLEGNTSNTRPKINSTDVAIHYIETFKGTTVSTHLELSRKGQLLDPWPDGFFEEGFRERFAD